MDKKLLDALNNLSVALDEIAQALSSKKEATSSTANAIKGGDFVRQINEIHIGVKSLQKDTKQILSNQQTILAMSKQRTDKNDYAEKIGQDKNKQKFIKDGLGVIMLMAVAILALGIAFKIVGGVNFFSVIAISTAILLLSIAFANVHTVLKKVGFQPKDGLNFILAVVSISMGIMLSSYILSKVKPIGLAQFFTTLFIAGGFVIIAHGISGFLNAFKGVGIVTMLKSILFLPLILPAIALGIAASSWALQLVKPIGLAQFFTTVFIAAAFSVIAFGMANLIGAFKHLSPKDIIMAAIGLPIILPAIALAIAGASYALQLVKPIGLAQFFTTIFIAVLFLILSYAITPLVKGMGGIKAKDVILLPFLFVTISIAVYVASLILSKIQPIPYGLLFNILVMGAVLGAVAFVMYFPMRLFAKMGIKDMLMGALGVIVVAGAIMVSSLLLSLGSYKNFPSASWAIGVGLSFLGFIPAMLVLGFISMTGLGAVAILIGAGMTIVVAGTIMAVSRVLAKGKYDYGKDLLPWALATSLLYLTFVPIMVALGAMGMVGAIISFFGGSDPFETAKGMMLQIADTIVAVSRRLNRGDYKGGPTKDWATGVSLAISAFSPVYMNLFEEGIFALFGKKTSKAEDMAHSIRTISDGIIYAGHIFSKSPGVWKNGPPKKWAEGVGLAIGAFAPVYEVLNSQGVLDALFGTEVTPEDMKAAMLTISDGIVEVAEYFNNSTVSFKGNYPTKKWGQGVGSAMQGFGSIYTMLYDDGWDVEELEEWRPSVNHMVNTIIDVAGMFDGETHLDWKTGKMIKSPAPSFKKYPTSEWVDGTISALQGICDIINYVYNEIDMDDVELDNYIISIKSMSRGIRDMSHALGKGDYSKMIPAGWMKNVTSTIMQYVNLTRYLTLMGGDAPKTGLSGILSGLLGKPSAGLDPIDKAVMGIVKLSKAYGVLAESLGKFGTSIQKMDADKINMFRSLTGNLAILSTLDSEMFNNMLDTLEERASVFADLVEQYEKEQSERTTSGGTGGKKSSGVKTTTPQKSDQQVLGEKLDRIAASLSDIQSVVGSRGTLSSYIDGLGKEANIGGNNNAPTYN